MTASSSSLGRLGGRVGETRRGSGGTSIDPRPPSRSNHAGEALGSGVSRSGNLPRMSPETAASGPLEHLRVERPVDGVVRVVLDNPDQRNAMSDQMTASWVRAMGDLAADRSVRAVVVTGAGTAFCSGGNTGRIASEPDAEVDYLRTRMMAFYRAWLCIRDLEVPTIAAVNGPAIGAGLCLA